MTSTCPVFLGKWPGVVDALGSCVLVNLFGRKFLLTAAHVADHDSDTQHLLVPGPERLINLEGKLVRTKMPTSGKREDDNLDMAYFELQNSFAAQINPFFTFLDVKDINFYDTTTSENWYSMIGFPGGESDVTGGQISSQSYNNIANACDTGFYHKYGYNTDAHILLYFNRKKVERLGTRVSLQPRNRKYIAPDPHGMSGCPVVALSSPSPSALDRYPMARLAGILTTYHPADHCYAATRINLYVHQILKTHPDLHMNYTGPFKHNREV